MDKTYTPEEIEAAARQAGLTLTPAWRDELVSTSHIVLDNKRRVRTPRDLAAEPAHTFTAKQA